MSGTPPAASTLAFSSLETWGGDCGAAASALEAPLLVPLAAFLPPNQPMIYCLVRVARCRAAKAVVVCGRIKGGAAPPQHAFYNILGPERSRGEALRGSACPHGPVRPVNCDRRRVRRAGPNPRDAAHGTRLQPSSGSARQYRGRGLMLGIC